MTFWCFFFVLNSIYNVINFQISKDDSLPKKICDGCLYKLDLCYQFHNTSVKAEKQLLTWLTQFDTNEKSSQEKIILKEETIELPIENETTTNAISTDAQSYILQQQQLPYQNIEFVDQSSYEEVEVSCFW